MGMEKVKVSIGGMNYTILSDKNIDYTKNLAGEVDERLKKITASNRMITLNQASVLLALGYADEAFENLTEKEDLRERLRISLEDAAKTKTKRDALERENQKLKVEIKELKKKLTEK